MMEDEMKSGSNSNSREETNSSLKRCLPITIQNPYSKKHISALSVSDTSKFEEDGITSITHRFQYQDMNSAQIAQNSPQRIDTSFSREEYKHTHAHKVPFNPYKSAAGSTSQLKTDLSSQLQDKNPHSNIKTLNPYYDKYGSMTKADHDCVCGTSLNLPSMDIQPSNHDGRILQSNLKDTNDCTKKDLTDLPKSSIFDSNFPKELLYDENRIKPIQDENRLKLIQAAQMNTRLENGWMLLPHQKIGVLKALQMRRCILAFDMGLGKTLVACVWAKAFKKVFSNLKVFVIAPVSLKKEWEKTAIEATGLKCEIDSGKKSSSLSTDSLDMCISTWAKIPKHIPSCADYFIVICDEAHNLQNMESTRTKDALKLMSNEKCIGALLLTGTPMKNGKPCNLFPLLKAVRHPFGDNQKLFEVFFCNGMQKNFNGRVVWDASGSMNLPLLNKHISSHVFHKTKDDCLKELPPKLREFKVVPVSSKFQVQHNRALVDLANIFKSVDSGGCRNETGQDSDAILSAFGRVRQIAANAKVDAAVTLAQSILEEESSIVIFTYFVNVAKEVQKKLEMIGWKCELLTGETPSKIRQEMVDNFQSGLSAVFIATFGAGGVGITLTAASTIVLMDRPWTPGDALQAEDRVRRIGQTKTVRSIWMRAFEVDEQIDNLIEQKSINANTVVDGRYIANDDQGFGKAAPKISIRQLVKTIVENNVV